MQKFVVLCLLFFINPIMSGDFLFKPCESNNKGIIKNFQELINIDKQGTSAHLSNIKISTIKTYDVCSNIKLKIIGISPTEQEWQDGIGNSIYILKQVGNEYFYLWLFSLEILDQKFETLIDSVTFKKSEIDSNKFLVYIEINQYVQYVRANDLTEISRVITKAYVFKVMDKNDIEIVACDIPIKTIVKNANNQIEENNEISALLAGTKLTIKKVSKGILDEQKKWVGVFDLSDSFSGKASKNSESIYQQSLALFKSGKKLEAARPLLESVGSKPWNITNYNVTMFNDLGYFLEQTSQYKDAVDVLTSVTAQFPDRTVAYLNLGDSYFGLQDITKAKAAYEQYIVLMKKEGKEKKIPARVFERIK